MPRSAPRLLLIALVPLCLPAFASSALGQTVSFSPQREFAVGTGPFWVTSGDLNDDGLEDLATSNRGSSDVSVLLGNGDGTFQAARSFPAGGGASYVGVGDFNRDGRQDLATADYNAGTISVLRGLGDGTFLAPQSFPAGGINPNCLAVGDFNGDGAPDMAVAVFGANEPNAKTAAVLLGTGTGGFSAAQTNDAERGPLWVELGDFNGDAQQDLVLANFGADTVSVLLGNGDGTFQPENTLPGGACALPPCGAAAVVVGDFNGDGLQDLGVVDYRSNELAAFPGQGDGTFGAPVAYSTGNSPATAVAADFTGEGVLDLAVPNWDFNAGSTVSLLVGNGDGTFATAQTVAVLGGRGVLGVVAADFNGDAVPDLALSNYAGNSVSVLINASGPPTGTSLAVNKAGTGSGTVTSSPSGINCGATCSAVYNSGTVVTLTASAAGGSTFNGWSGGGCAGTGACSVTMSAATTVTASFTAQPQQFTLTVNKAGTGSGTVTSSPSGINCGATCSAVYNGGTVVTLTASAAGGSTFSGWSGGGCSGTGTCSVTISAATAVTASFTAQPQQFTLTVNKAGTGSGTVTSNPAGINCGASCSAAYNSGTVVTLTASAAGGSTFSGWSGGGCSGTGTCSVTMSAATTVTASFTAQPQQFTLTVNKAGTGSGTVTSSPAGISCGATCSAAYNSGTVVTLTASAAGGSTFSGWSGGGCSGTGTCNVTMSAATTVTATFGAATVSAPTLKWQYGGCTTGPYCDTGWYSSPAVADLDADGRPEVIWGAYDVVALNGADGSQKWRAASPNRVWPAVAVADLTGDGTLEVVVGRSSDQLTVYNRTGGVVWTRNPFGNGEVRSLAVADLEADGQLEIVVGHAGGSGFQLNVFQPNGSVRSGWPARHSGDPGFGSGLFNENVAVADMVGSGFKEIFGPASSHYITALNRSGNQLSANAIYNNISPAGPKVWSQVGVHVSNAVDLRGFANCGSEHRPDFSLSAPVIADLNGDAVSELVVVGSVYNCGTDPYTDLHHLPFVLKRDRTRWSGSGFDWTVVPTPQPGSAPRSLDYEVIENAVPNAVVADLDGDGFKEILYPSYDGRLHAYWLDKTEHGSWPYRVPTSGAAGDDFRFAGEPVVADLNNDGRAEVVFTSWPKKATGRVGQLHVLNYLGVELHRMDLPPAALDASWNGGLAAPTLANIDADADLELVVGTVGSGAVAYDLPNSASARVLWGTGRGSARRAGTTTP